MSTLSSAADRLAVGVLISGRGSNMVALAEACASDVFPAQIVVVAANEPDAEGLVRAAEMGLATAVVDHRKHSSREQFERRLASVLLEHRVELVCLAGFMRLLTGTFISCFPDRILNIHPSLLPSFPGLHAQRQALEHGVRWSGCTVHVVVEEMDAGPIVLQAAVPVQSDDNEQQLASRILIEEHRIYPEAVRVFAEARLSVEERRVAIRD